MRGKIDYNESNGYSYYTDKSNSLYVILMSISGGNLQECIERQTEYIGNDLNIANNGIRNKVCFI